MSDDLLRAADARPDSVRTHWDGCYVDHDLCLIAKLAARVRDLEAEVAGWMERAERQDTSIIALEAERDAALKLERIWCAAFNEGNAERDALRAEVERLRGALLRLASELRHSDVRLAESIDAALAGEKL